MAFFPPTGPISTYGSVLDIKGSFVERLDPVVLGVVWECHLTTVWIDCVTPLGWMLYCFISNYFRLD
ncbi:hypothetical protein NL676_029593, partial [Syzygium grande]